MKIVNIKEKEGEPKVKRLRTMLNSLGVQLSDQYFDEIEKHLEGSVKKMEVASSQRTKAANPGVLDVVVIPVTLSELVTRVRQTIDANVKEKGNMIEFTYKEGTIRLIMANELNFHNVVSMVSGFSTLDMNIRNRIQKDGFKYNRYGIWKNGKLMYSGRSDIIRILDR